MSIDMTISGDAFVEMDGLPETSRILLPAATLSTVARLQTVSGPATSASVEVTVVR